MEIFFGQFMPHPITFLHVVYSGYGFIKISFSHHLLSTPSSITCYRKTSVIRNFKNPHELIFLFFLLNIFRAENPSSFSLFKLFFDERTMQCQHSWWLWNASKSCAGASSLLRHLNKSHRPLWRDPCVRSSISGAYILHARRLSQNQHPCPALTLELLQDLSMEAQSPARLHWQ